MLEMTARLHSLQLCYCLTIKEEILYSHYLENGRDQQFCIIISNGSSGWVREGKKHEIYVVEFGGHLFYDRGGGGAGMAPSASPGSATDNSISLCRNPNIAIN